MKKALGRSITHANWGLALLIALFAASLSMAVTGHLQVADEVLVKELSEPAQLVTMADCQNSQ